MGHYGLNAVACGVRPCYTVNGVVPHTLNASVELSLPKGGLTEPGA